MVIAVAVCKLGGVSSVVVPFQCRSITDISITGIDISWLGLALASDQS